MKLYMTKERMNGILPENIKETTVLTPTAKKVLAYLMNCFYSLSMTDENGYFYRTNNEMRKDLGVGMGKMLEAIQELIDTNLVIRKTGETLPTGERLASRYYVQWDNLEEPIVKPTASDRIKKYLSKKTVDTKEEKTVTVKQTAPTVNVKVEIPIHQHIEAMPMPELDANVDDDGFIDGMKLLDNGEWVFKKDELEHYLDQQKIWYEKDKSNLKVAEESLERRKDELKATTTEREKTFVENEVRKYKAMVNFLKGGLK